MYTFLGSLIAMVGYHLYGYLGYTLTFSARQNYGVLPFVVLGILVLEFLAWFAALIRRLISKLPRKPSASMNFTYLLMGLVVGLGFSWVDLNTLTSYALKKGHTMQGLGINPTVYFTLDLVAYTLLVYGFFNALSNLRYTISPATRPAPAETPAPEGPQIHRRYTLEELQSMDDRDFERLVAGYFKATGHNVMLTPQSRDGGKDVVLEKDGVQTYVECKRYAADHPVGEKEVRTLLGSMTGDRIEKGIFVTSSYFSRDAEGYCHRVGIEPINGIRLLSLLHQHGNVHPV